MPAESASPFSAVELRRTHVVDVRPPLGLDLTGLRDVGQATRWRAAYALLRALVGLYRRIGIPKIVAFGTRNLPPGPCILAPNHGYVSDAFALVESVPGPLHFFIQEEAFHVPALGALLSAAGQIAVRPDDPDRCIEEGTRALRSGRRIVIFPEGRLNHGGPIGPARTGAARLCLASGAPIVPVAIHTPSRHIHMVQALYCGRRARGGWQFGGLCAIAFGRPWKPFGGSRRLPRPALRAATEELHGRLVALLEHVRHEVGS